MAHKGILLQQAQPSSLDSGVFTWDIASDQFFADSALALLFGLDPAVTMIGLPMQRYLDRVHPDDKPRVARAVHNAVVTGVPCQQSYRVQAANGGFGEIMAFGRCFRNSDGTPSQYAGIVFPVAPVVDDSGALLDLCAQAHRGALKAGRIDVARVLREIMESLDEDRAGKRRHQSH